ncbi:MAG: O-antigen ligase family protein [Candidatus Coatesbacteria bacterium]
MARDARSTPTDRALSLGWTVLPAAVLFSITAGQALASVLILRWIWTLAAGGRARGRRRTDLPAAATPQHILLPLGAFLVWASIAAVLANQTAPDLAGAWGKWLFALALPAAWAHARRTGSVRPPLFVLLAAGLAILPFGLRDFLATDSGRAGGFSGSGPHLGSNLMMAFIVALAFVFEARGRAATVASGAAALLLLGGIGLSFNRSALLGAAVGAGVICARRRPVLLAAALAVVAAGLAARPVSKPVLRLRSALQFDQNPTARERLMMWSAAARMIRARPIEGVASRARFAGAYPSFRDEDALEARPGHVHNSYLQTAVLHGLPGLGLLLWWLAVLGRLALVQGPAYEAAWPLLIAVLVNAVFDFVLADGQHALMWYVLAGLLLGSQTPAVSVAGARRFGGRRNADADPSVSSSSARRRA